MSILKLMAVFAISFGLVMAGIIVFSDKESDQSVVSGPAVRCDDAGALVIPYGQWDGRPVQLMVDPKGNVVLRVRYDDGYLPLTDTALEYLKNEVLRLTESGEPMAVGGYRYQIEVNGPPIWGPHDTLGPACATSALFFAEGAVVGDDYIIRANGREGQAYNGYVEWKPWPSTR